MFRRDEDQHGREKPGSLSDTLARWWKGKNHKLAYKLLYMAQHGNKNERCKAVTALGSLSHLKGSRHDVSLVSIVVFLLDTWNETLELQTDVRFMQSF